MIVATAALCLALNVYQESRGESIPGQYAVALVTRNRAQGSRHICSTVFEPRQFSWTTTVHRARGGWVIPKALEPTDERAWHLAKIVARVTLSGRMHDFTDGSTFYHTTRVHPCWRLALAPTKRIDRHQFYRAREHSQS